MQLSIDIGSRCNLICALVQAAFNAVQSFHSDSAVAFAMFLNHLPDMHSQLQPAQLLAAIEVRHMRIQYEGLTLATIGFCCCTHCMMCGFCKWSSSSTC